MQMATFKGTREMLLASYASNTGIITIEEYALLFEEIQHSAGKELEINLNILGKSSR